MNFPILCSGFDRSTTRYGRVTRIRHLEVFRGATTDTELMILCHGLRFHITVSAKYFQDDSKTTVQDLALLHKLDPQDAAVEQSDEVESVEVWKRSASGSHPNATLS